jgi:hypothetical protein
MKSTGKLQFSIQKKINFFFICKFFQKILSSNPWIRIGIQPKKLDPDPYSINPDPKHYWKLLEDKYVKYGPVIVVDAFLPVVHCGEAPVHSQVHLHNNKEEC